MVVGTAASMDGYTSYGASITFEGAKQTFSCPAPLGVLADTAIIAAAPKEMTASGYADLFAKVPAGADWIISDALGVEPLDERAFAIVQDGLQDALGDPEGVRQGTVETIGPLIEGLMLGGFAMQAHQTSRPASGADHQFSHLWNMEHHKMADGHTPVARFPSQHRIARRDRLLRTIPPQRHRPPRYRRAVAAWPELAEAEKICAGTLCEHRFPEIGLKETQKYIGKQQLREQLATLKITGRKSRQGSKSRSSPFAEASRRLRIVGAPPGPRRSALHAGA